MPYVYALAPHGRTLATRPLGKDLRADLVRRAGSETCVKLDFSGVVSTSHSFADEFVAGPAEEIAAGEVGFEASASGLSAEVERVVRKAMERRGVELPIPA